MHKKFCEFWPWSLCGKNNKDRAIAGLLTIQPNNWMHECWVIRKKSLKLEFTHFINRETLRKTYVTLHFMLIFFEYLVCLCLWEKLDGLCFSYDRILLSSCVRDLDEINFIWLFDFWHKQFFAESSSVSKRNTSKEVISFYQYWVLVPDKHSILGFTFFVKILH